MTPQSIDNDVHKLLKSMEIATSPIYVSVQPEPDAYVNECFPSVAAKMDRDGGERVIGWAIWKSDIIVEAVFHAIWKSPDNNLLDITAKEFAVERILFVEDPKATYDGRQVDNKRLNICGKPLVDDLIIIKKVLFKITNKGDLAYKREVLRTDIDVDMLQNIKQLELGIFRMIEAGKSHNSRCFCGSQDKYKHCYGRGIRKILTHI